MNWFNPYGLIFMAVIMIPNILYAVRCKDGFENLWDNKTVQLLEQLGRFGCFGFMIFNIPGLVLGFWSDEAFAVYLIADSILTGLYCLIWALCFRKNSIFRALSLSILPSILFLASGILSRSLPLILSALIFAPCHIGISYQNTKRHMKRNDEK